MAWESVLGTVQRYYSEKLRVHGPTPAGVDWNSTESQQLRFDLLLQLCAAILYLLGRKSHTKIALPSFIGG